MKLEKFDKDYLKDIQPKKYKKGDKLLRSDLRYSLYRYNYITKENKLICYNKTISEMETELLNWIDIPNTDAILLYQKYWL